MVHYLFWSRKKKNSFVILSLTINLYYRVYFVYRHVFLFIRDVLYANSLSIERISDVFMLLMLLVSAFLCACRKLLFYHEWYA